MSPKFCLGLSLLLCCLVQTHASASSVRTSLCVESCSKQPSAGVSKSALSNATQAVSSFFQAEKLSGWAWGTVGLVSAGAGVGLFFAESPLLKGMSYPMMIIGGVQLIYGIILLSFSGRRSARALQQLQSNPSGFLTKEAERIRRNAFLFSLIEWFEIIVAATGVGLVTGGMIGGMPIVAGVGLGLMLKGITMFALDSQAHQRYSKHYKVLKALLPSLTVSPSAEHRIHGRSIRVGLAWSGHF